MCAPQVIATVLSTFQESEQRSEATAWRMRSGPGWRAFRSRWRRPRAMPCLAPCPRSGGSKDLCWVTDPWWPREWLVMALARSAWSEHRRHASPAWWSEARLSRERGGLWRQWDGIGQKRITPGRRSEPTRSIVVGDRTRRCTSRRAELKPLHDAPSFINVRAAGERRCSADQGART